MMSRVKIPDERLPVLIGKGGTVKQFIEEKTGVSISVHDEIVIEGDALSVLTAETMVQAIGRGFALDATKTLLDENATLLVIQLPKERNALVRTKARIIGTRGKAKRKIEHMTGAEIAVYGKTVSVIGEYGHAHRARIAIEMLLNGSPHKNVYKFLSDSVSL